MVGVSLALASCYHSTIHIRHGPQMIQHPVNLMIENQDLYYIVLHIYTYFPIITFLFDYR